MAWEYLDKMDYRYKLVADNLPVEGMDVVELNAGNGRFINYLKGYKSYMANDIKPLSEDVIEMPDDLFKTIIERCDVLAIFGYAGKLRTTHPLESSTIDDSFVYLINKFKPKYIVFESVSDYDVTDELVPEDYKVIYFNHNADEDWLKNRSIYIFEKVM